LKIKRQVDADLQPQAKALGDPTRHRLFRYIVESPGPVGVNELTAFLRLNHNAIRQHLAVLKDAGLVREEIEDRELPGRPRLLYRLDPEASGRWDTTGPYTWLAKLLSQAVSRNQDPRQVGHDFGARHAAELCTARDPVDLLEREMVQRGFRPTRIERGRRIDFVLGRCPFAEVAESDSETVCQLHLGLAEGLAEGLGGLAVERLVAKNPHELVAVLSFGKPLRSTSERGLTDVGSLQQHNSRVRLNVIWSD
jgi:predicted ArsR family transcriptional regulator